MPVRDIVTTLNVIRSGQHAIASNTTTNGNSADTKDFDNGLMLVAYSNIYTDGTYVVTFMDSPDNSVFTDVPAANYCGGITSISIAAINTAGVNCGKLGVFGTARYVRPKIVSTGVTTGATLQLVLTQAAEIAPTL